MCEEFGVEGDDLLRGITYAGAEAESVSSFADESVVSDQGSLPDETFIQDFVSRQNDEMEYHSENEAIDVRSQYQEVDGAQEGADTEWKEKLGSLSQLDSQTAEKLKGEVSSIDVKVDHDQVSFGSSCNGCSGTCHGSCSGSCAGSCDASKTGRDCYYK